jgi:YVTN family beta-propeller protein
MNTRAFVVVLVVTSLTASIAVGQYLEATIPVGHTPTSILWNPTSNKVYVCNEQSGSVSVISGATNQVVATITGMDYPVGLAWNSVRNKVYCTDGEGNRLVVIDGVGDSVLARVHVSGWPNKMTYNSALDKLYIACNDNQRVVVVDGATDDVLTTIAMGSDPFWPVWSPTTNRVFCPLDIDLDSVAIINCWTDERVGAVAVGRMLSRLCWNPVNGLVYANCEDAVYALSTDGTAVVATIAATGFWLKSAAFAPYPNKLYVGDRNEGCITVIDCSTQTALDTMRGVVYVVEDLVCDTIRGRLYAVGGNDVAVVDVRRDSVLMTVQLGPSPNLMAWNQTHSRVYASDEAADLVYVLRDTSTAIQEHITAEVQLSPLPTSIVHACLRLPIGGGGALVDATGSVVQRLRYGANDVSHLGVGAYIVLTDGRPTAKVLIVR